MNLDSLYYYFEKQLPEILCELPLGEEKRVGIYGIGMHTKRLLQRYQTDVGPIKAELIFIDSKKKSLTEKYNDCDIYNVCDIEDLSLDAVILSSPLYEDEMFKTMKELYADKYDIYRFYEKRKADIFQVGGIYLEIDKLEESGKLRINFVDFWPGFDCYNNDIISLLYNRYRIEISDAPDVLICSQFGEEHKKFKDCKKILFITEVRPFDFKHYDYVIGFQYFTNKNFFHFNFYAPRNRNEILNRLNFSNHSLAKRKFCNFIYSNETLGEGAYLRKQFCKELSKYRHIDCPGKVLNNMKNAIEPREGSWVHSKEQFIKKYKFTIAFENEWVDGYTTEKLWQPLKVGSIPIYWGNRRIGEEVCSEAFINCNEFDNDFNAVIERVKEIDQDDEYYMYMLQKSPLTESYDPGIDNLYRLIEKVISE